MYTLHSLICSIILLVFLGRFIELYNPTIENIVIDKKQNLNRQSNVDETHIYQCERHEFLFALSYHYYYHYCYYHCY